MEVIEIKERLSSCVRYCDYIEHFGYTCHPQVAHLLVELKLLEKEVYRLGTQKRNRRGQN